MNYYEKHDSISISCFYWCQVRLLSVVLDISWQTRVVYVLFVWYIGATWTSRLPRRRWFTRTWWCGRTWTYGTPRTNRSEWKGWCTWTTWNTWTTRIWWTIWQRINRIFSEYRGSLDYSDQFNLELVFNNWYRKLIKCQVKWNTIPNTN